MGVLTRICTAQMGMGRARALPGLSALDTLPLALLVALGVPVALLVAAASAHATSVTISPLAGTPDASPQTQISFLGVAVSQIHNISVVGSRSGSHTGRLESYASAIGASLLPSRPFLAGERVVVRATVDRTAVGTEFTVADQDNYDYKPSAWTAQATPALPRARTELRVGANASAPDGFDRLRLAPGGSGRRLLDIRPWGRAVGANDRGRLGTARLV